MGLIRQIIGAAAVGLGILGLQTPGQGASWVNSSRSSEKLAGSWNSTRISSLSPNVFKASGQIVQPVYDHRLFRPSVAPVGATQLADSSICPPSALSQLVKRPLEAGETLETIAQQYGLIPATLQGMNPVLRQADLPVGAEIVIPPYNGIQVDVPPGQTWGQVAEAYNVRADVLFEINGCQATVPSTIFIPGVNWFPGLSAARSSSSQPSSPTPSSTHVLQGYPLPEQASIISHYGWRPHPARNELVFNSGVTLAVAANTSVLVVGDGVVAFSGLQQGDSNLVVINHRQGLQTRYGNLAALSVSVGETVRQGTQIGVVAAGSPGTNSYLYFEVRSNSDLGWVARNPQEYIPALGLR